MYTVTPRFKTKRALFLAHVQKKSFFFHKKNQIINKTNQNRHIKCWTTMLHYELSRINYRLEIKNLALVHFSVPELYFAIFWFSGCHPVCNNHQTFPFFFSENCSNHLSKANFMISKLS